MPAKGRRGHDERALMFVGTSKGVFVYESDFERDKWKRTGPYLQDQAVPAIAFDHRDGKTVYVATWGSGLHRTRDFGRSWERIGNGLTSERVSQVVIGDLSEPGSLWVGLDSGALAVSRDGGGSFAEVKSFRAIPSAREWRGRDGEAVVSSIVVHPGPAASLHVAVDVGGVWRSDDGGDSWRSCSDGIAPNYPPSYAHPEAHRGVHRLVSNPARPERLYASTDSGLYRTDDGGTSWREVSAGLPSRLTRSVVVSPSRPGTIYAVPLGASADGVPRVRGQLAVWRSIDGGDSWERFTEGLPERVDATIHREAMDFDTLDEEGLYIGTAGGHIVLSADDGESWTTIVTGLAPILSLELVTEQE
jgi:photosystem II stability/assembly factor-like uncharacterized protein